MPSVSGQPPRYAHRRGTKRASGSKPAPVWP